jgi:hypothetical protein
MYSYSTMARPGPKTDPLLGPLAPRTLMLDELTVTQLRVVGLGNLSHGVRRAARMAFLAYQQTPEESDHEQHPRTSGS